jgi:hypothetical protein
MDFGIRVIELTDLSIINSIIMRQTVVFLLLVPFLFGAYQMFNGPSQSII